MTTRKINLKLIQEYNSFGPILSSEIRTNLLTEINTQCNDIKTLCKINSKNNN